MRQSWVQPWVQRRRILLQRVAADTLGGTTTHLGVSENGAWTPQDGNDVFLIGKNDYKHMGGNIRLKLDTAPLWRHGAASKTLTGGMVSCNFPTSASSQQDEPGGFHQGSDIPWACWQDYGGFNMRHQQVKCPLYPSVLVVWLYRYGHGRYGSKLLSELSWIGEHQKLPILVNFAGPVFGTTVGAITTNSRPRSFKSSIVQAIHRLQVTPRKRAAAWNASVVGFQSKWNGMIWDNDMAWLYDIIWDDEMGLEVFPKRGDPTASIPQPSDVNWDELRILDAFQRSSCLGQFPLKSTLPSRKLSYTGICWGLVFCFWPAFHFGWRWICVINAPVYLHFDTPVAIHWASLICCVVQLICLYTEPCNKQYSKICLIHPHMSHFQDFALTPASLRQGFIQIMACAEETRRVEASRCGGVQVADLDENPRGMESV